MGVHRRVPVADGVTRVEFDITNDDYLFVALSRTDGCHTLLQELLPRGEGRYAEFFTVSGVGSSRVLEHAAAHDAVEASLLVENDADALFEFEVDDCCPVVFLSERGALPRRVVGVDGTGHISAEIPTADAGAVVDGFLDAHPGATLTSKRDQSDVAPMVAHRRFQQVVTDRLTERQQTVLVAAHEAGYYEWPRDTTAEGLADDLGIATPTALKHLRAVERTFVETFFETPEVLPGGPRTSER